MWAGRRRRGGEGLIWVPPPAIVPGAGRPCEPIRTQHVNKQAGQVRVTPELSVRTRERVQTPLTGTQRGADSERNPWLCSGTGEKRRIAGRSTLTMTSCHHHSGYLADDEAGHTTYVARPPKKPPFLEMGQAYKSGHMPHPPSRYTHADSSGLRGHRRNPRDPRPFGSFLDFLVEGQVLDSLQTVVEEATERMTTMKTEAGVPLVEVQDPIEVPRGGQRVRARPSLSTVHRHRARPSLCTGRPNNYPSSSSSMSDSHSSFTAGWLGSHSQDSDLGARGMGSLPPMRDKLLLEKNLKRLLKLENRGKGIGRSCFQTDSLLWDSLGSQASSQRTQEPPLSWFSGLLGSSTGTAQTSELGPVERELTFLKRERCKEIKSLLNQPASFDLPGYCSFREPHRTLDFLAEHHLFPALQSVVRQAVDKLSGARRHDGCPLFPSEWEPATEPNSDSVQDSKPEPNSDSVQDSKPATPTDGEETYNVLPIRVSSSKMIRRKSTKGRGQAKSKEGGSPLSSAQVANRLRVEVTPTEEPKVPSPHPSQEAPGKDPKLQRPPIPSSGPPNSSQKANPWQSLYHPLPIPGIVVEGPSSQTQSTIQDIPPLTSPYPGFSHHLPLFSPLPSSVVRGISPSAVSLRPEMTLRVELGGLGKGLRGKGSFSYHP
ncbi:coiled-coil domain-containing protein 116 isoform X2 [Canis lupus familiaris]|uniref:coiled-coil domain-containing protein 116 isoform X2 n=1 Tax=Canis lupus familiaris TaxID=9615 RepID=UPI0015F1826F|nr:coiled-coil domain-containing protein 116 isoform X2 [Canis lupus familiaris]XP_025330718.2 coiled-coil domain-containing protein 116 isoform X1 [Canis lupus dingo]